MTANYSGSDASIGVNEAPVIAVPVDGDPNAAATFNVAYKKLADYIAFLNKYAVITEHSGSTPNSRQLYLNNDLATNNNVSLSKSGDQTISKTNSGSLTLNVGAVGDLNINSANGNVVLNSTGGNVKITHGGTDYLATDFSNTTISLKRQTPIYPALNTGWSGNCFYTRCAQGRVLIEGYISRAGGAGSVAFTLPSGYRPATEQTFLVFYGAVTPAILTIGTNGDISSSAPDTVAIITNGVIFTANGS